MSKEETNLRRDLRHARAIGSHSGSGTSRPSRIAIRSRPDDNGISRIVWSRRSAHRRITREPKKLSPPGAARCEIPLPNLTNTSVMSRWRKKMPAPRCKHGIAALGANPRHLRVLIKVARVEQRQHHWLEADTAWSAALAMQVRRKDSRNAAFCRHICITGPKRSPICSERRSWARRKPEVLRCAKLFDQLAKFLAENRNPDAQLAVSPNDHALLTDRSLLFLRSEDFEMALEDAEAAAKLAPWAIRPKLFAGIALIRLGRIGEAEKRLIRKSFRIEVLTPRVHRNNQPGWTQNFRRAKNAELYATRAWHLNMSANPPWRCRMQRSAAQLDPKSASAHAEKSYAFMKLGQAEKAFEEIQHATTLDSNYATAWQYRGELEMEQQNYLAAVESLSRALAVNQTITALEKREACYRTLGWSIKADEDQRMLEKLGANRLK